MLDQASQKGMLSYVHLMYCNFAPFSCINIQFYIYYKHYTFNIFFFVPVSILRVFTPPNIPLYLYLYIQLLITYINQTLDFNSYDLSIKHFMYILHVFKNLVPVTFSPVRDDCQGLQSAVQYLHGTVFCMTLK